VAETDPLLISELSVLTSANPVAGRAAAGGTGVGNVDAGASAAAGAAARGEAFIAAAHPPARLVTTRRVEMIEQRVMRKQRRSPCQLSGHLLFRTARDRIARLAQCRPRLARGAAVVHGTLRDPDDCRVARGLYLPGNARRTEPRRQED
jgi:hypothetical protein